MCFDRTETTSTVWLGLTMTCSRCHDHKYDPISIKEYYQFYAFFNNTSESGRNERGKQKPVLKYIPQDQQAKLATLDKQIDDLKLRMVAADAGADQAQAKWEQTQEKQSPQNWQLLDPYSFKSTQGATLEKLSDLSIRAGGKNPNNDEYNIVAKTSATNITAIRLEALIDSKTTCKKRRARQGRQLCPLRVRSLHHANSEPKGKADSSEVQQCRSGLLTRSTSH